MSEELRTRLHSDLDAVGAVALGWQHINHNDLSRLLKAMPPKLRNKVLSRNRTPSSKVTAVTARLLFTNVTRRGGREREWALDIIATPLRADAEAAREVAADSADPLGILREAVDVQVDEWGGSAVTFGAVAALYDDPVVHLPWMVACARAGQLPAELAALADRYADEADALLAADAEDLDREDGNADVLEELRILWAEARDSAVRLDAAVSAGTVVDQSDVDAVVAWSARLVAESDGWDADAPAMAALEAAVTAATAATGLTERLARLNGPPALAAPVAEVVAAAKTAVGDPVLAERLERFADLVAAADAMERLAIATELRPQPQPPAPELLDAALAGLLTLDGAANSAAAAVPDVEGSAKADAPVGSVLAEVSRGTAASGGGTARDGSVAEDLAEPADEPGDGALEVDEAGYGGETLDRDEAGEGDETDEVGAAVTAFDVTEAAGTTATPDRLAPAPEATARATETSAPAAPPADVPLQPAAPSAEAPAPGGDITRGRTEAADEPGTGASVVTPEEAVDDSTAAATLAELVAASRFGLAQHLATVLGQDYRASILREAAYASAVRTVASPAAAEFVALAAQTTVNQSDTGSVLLRAASLVRVALIDPASGTPALLRSHVGALSAWPQLQELAVAIAAATEQNVAVPAGGVDLDLAQAHDQARAIASWAEDTLKRPPRHNRLFRGIEIWKTWTDAEGPLGKLLAAVARNDAADVEAVRSLIAPLAKRSDIEQAIDAADKALRQGRSGRAQKITGPARGQLLRNVTEIIEQAQAWHDLTDALAGGWASSQRNELARTALRLRPRLHDEICGVSGDDWAEAAARAAAASLDASSGLLANEPLPGAAVDIDPIAALHRGLTLVEGFPLGADLQPLAAPTAAQIVAGARRSRTDAFASRLAARDFSAAEAILELHVGPADTSFDEDAAARELTATEKHVRALVSARWRSVGDQFSAARARGRVSEDDAARLYGLLLQAQPDSTETGVRRDLGNVAVELDRIETDLAQAVGARRAAVVADIEGAVADGEVPDTWHAKLRELLAGDELGAAEEYLHRARAGETPPSDGERDIDVPVDLAYIPEAWPKGFDADVVAAAARGGSAGPVDFGAVPDIARPAVAEALAAWLALSQGPRPDDLDTAVAPVLRLLGLIPTRMERGAELRRAATRGRLFFDVHGDKSGYAYVPDYGSRSAGRRRFMLCWETDLPPSQLWDLAAANAPADQPVYLLWMGMLSTKARAELAREARRRRSGTVVVIDDAVLLRCAEVGRQSWDVTMRAVLPYVAANPYDPDSLVNTPEEMFYGRRLERQLVARMTGTSFISGGRRLGKSALLRSVQRELAGSDVLVLLVVIQHVAATPPNDPAELWPVVASRLSEAKVLPEGTEGTGEAVSAGVRSWLAANPERRLLLMLDECDFFLRSDARNRFRNVVLLRDLMSDADAGGRFKVVFSGLHDVARYRRLPNQPLSHLPQPLVIGPLDATSASSLVRRPLHALGFQITDPQVDRIVTYCACNASVIQLTCGRLLERLRSLPVSGPAPWPVPDDVLVELLRSAEVEKGVRERLNLTLELDHRYKLLANLMAAAAVSDGLGAAVTAADLRRQAVDYWPEGFASQGLDDVRSLCDELVGLGVFAGDAEAGYRMLSPATVRLFGDPDEIGDELLRASEEYEPDLIAGAAGHRIQIGEARFSPLTAGQLGDVAGDGTTQLRIVAGSRALRSDAVADALRAAAKSMPAVTVVEAANKRQWRDGMVAPPSGHSIVVADMTVGVSRDSWEESLDAARRRGGTRTARGTRAGVLVAGPFDRWLLDRLVGDGDLAGVAVGLRRVDLPSLKAWDRIAELDLAHPARQQRLLEVTGGWPLLVERVIARMRKVPFDTAADELAVHLGTVDGARELVAAAGLDPSDEGQPADAGLIAVFGWLVANGWRDPLGDLAELASIDDYLAGVVDPAGVVAILDLLDMLDIDEDGLAQPEPVLARCFQTGAAAAP